MLMHDREIVKPYRPDYMRSTAELPTTQIETWHEPASTQRRDLLITLDIGVRMLVCVAAIWYAIGLLPYANEGEAVLLALACGALIAGALGKRS